jgi:hypothetical protein
MQGGPVKEHDCCTAFEQSTDESFDISVLALPHRLHYDDVWHYVAQLGNDACSEKECPFARNCFVLNYNFSVRS